MIETILSFKEKMVNYCVQGVLFCDTDDVYAEVFGRWNDFDFGLSTNQTPLKSIDHINTGYRYN